MSELASESVSTVRVRQPAGQPARREYGFALLAGAAGAAIILLAVRQRWAQAVFTPPKPLTPQVVNVSGVDLVPLAGALALAALAGLAAGDPGDERHLPREQSLGAHAAGTAVETNTVSSTTCARSSSSACGSASSRRPTVARRR